MIMEALDLFASLLREHIEGNWRLFKDEKYFCALLNSCYDVSQKLKKKSDNILEDPDVYKIEEDDNTKLDDAFDDRICKFTNLGKQCSVLLAGFVYEEVLKTNIIDKIWTEREQAMMEDLVLTLKDFFEDFKRWIQEPYFFWEAVKALLDQRSASALKQLDAESLAEHIRNDLKLLDEYFGNEDEFGDVAKVWNRNYKILNAIHAVLDCDAGFFETFARPIEANERWEPI